MPLAFCLFSPSAQRWAKSCDPCTHGFMISAFIMIRLPGHSVVDTVADATGMTNYVRSRLQSMRDPHMQHRGLDCQNAKCCLRRSTFFNSTVHSAPAIHDFMKLEAIQELQYAHALRCESSLGVSAVDDPNGETLVKTVSKARGRQ